MKKMTLAIHQMTSGVEPSENFETMRKMINDAGKQGADFYFAPEMSLLLDQKRKRAASKIYIEGENQYIAEFRSLARKHNIWLHIGSFALRATDNPDRLVNRTLVINGSGEIAARYDKMHLFDVNLADGESWLESKIYNAGAQPVLVNTPAGPMGLSICYDLRFPALYQALTQAGARILTVPAAFTVPTGKAHWHALIRARAIEAQCFVVAAAQSGEHQDGRATYGHSLVVDPWGEVLLDMGSDEAMQLAEIDLEQTGAVRRQIPALSNRRDILDVKNIDC